jgi:hypothetical protein
VYNNQRIKSFISFHLAYDFQTPITTIATNRDRRNQFLQIWAEVAKTVNYTSQYFSHKLPFVNGRDNLIFQFITIVSFKECQIRIFLRVYRYSRYIHPLPTGLALNFLCRLYPIPCCFLHKSFYSMIMIGKQHSARY